MPLTGETTLCYMLQKKPCKQAPKKARGKTSKVRKSNEGPEEDGEKLSRTKE